MAITRIENDQAAVHSRFLYAVPWVAGVAMLALFLILGNWQLQRADEKRAVLSGFEAIADTEHRPLNLATEPLESLRFRPVAVSGQYLPEQQFLLDNQVSKGQVGYRVLTPLVHADSGQTVLIERGWIPRGPDRDTLPQVSAGLPGETTTVLGHVYLPFGKGLRLGPMDETSVGWPRVIQYLDFETIGERLQRVVPPLTVRLDPDQPHGYDRDWRPVLPMGPERHLAYAVQWFGLALALVIIVAILVYRRRFRDHGD